MYRSIILFLFLALPPAYAHEMVPTYPKLEPSYVENIWKAELEIFNKRKDVEYYEIGVFDEEWQPIPFVSSYKVIYLKYLGHLGFEIYVRASDADRAVYVCSQSKLRGDGSGTLLASKICSKFQH